LKWKVESQKIKDSEIEDLKKKKKKKKKKIETKKIKDSEIEDLKKKKKEKKNHLAVKVCFILYKKGHIQMNFPKF